MKEEFITMHNAEVDNSEDAVEHAQHLMEAMRVYCEIRGDEMMMRLLGQAFTAVLHQITAKGVCVPVYEPGATEPQYLEVKIVDELPSPTVSKMEMH